MLVFTLVFMNCPHTNAQAAKKQPKDPQPHTAVFRIISTTDLHGQVSTTHYDTASEKPGSLAQAYTLIKEARQETGTRNTMTVDTGDSVYGYAADYILENSGEMRCSQFIKPCHWLIMMRLRWEIMILTMDTHILTSSWSCPA